MDTQFLFYYINDEKMFVELDVLKSNSNYNFVIKTKMHSDDFIGGINQHE